MNNVNPADAFRQMAKDGQESLDNQVADKGGLAYQAVQRLFAQVLAGKVEPAVLEQLADWADNPIQGLPTNQQPAQLGSGGQAAPPQSQPQPIADEQEALDVLFRSAQISNGVKAALRRLLNPRDPNPLLVEADGTPSALRDAERERDRQEARADAAEQAKIAAEQQLNDERDQAKAGSLANRLAAVQAAAATPADVVAKADVKAQADTALAKVQAVKQSPMKGGASSKTEAEQAVQAVIDLVS